MQKFWSLLFGVTMLAALLLFVVAPFAGWWLPKNIATFGAGIDWLFYLILVITGIFFVLTEAILVYNLWKFTYVEGHKAQYSHGNHKLEVIWAVIPGIILLVLAIVQINVWAEVKFQKNMPKPDGDTLQMEVFAKQWEWRIRYPSSNDMEAWKKQPEGAKRFGQKPSVDDYHTVNEIHVYKEARVLVHLKTQDVIHSFFLPHLRLKQDSLPGKTIPVWFAVTEHNTEMRIIGGKKRWLEIGLDPATGKSIDPKSPAQVWELACAEFCGARHSMMRGKLYVHKDRADFLEWLKESEKEQNSHQARAANATVAAQ